MKTRLLHPFVFLLTLLTILTGAVIACAGDPGPEPENKLPDTVKVPEFGDIPVVPWDKEDKWSFGGDRFHKENKFYLPLDPNVPHPWSVTVIDITTWFQQDVIDGFAPSLECLIGEKWKDVKKFMEAHKFGTACHFTYVITDKKYTIYAEKGKPKEEKLEVDLVEGGLEKFFCEPKIENFANVDGVRKEDAHKTATELYKDRLAWVEKIHQAAAAIAAHKNEDPPK